MTLARSQARKALVAHLLRAKPDEDPKRLWSEIGYCLNRWAFSRVYDAVQQSQSIEEVFAALQKQRTLMHLPKRCA
jgi:hypothetical protein